MIKFLDDTVFNTNADCIVNTVNCVGVMGKGLALEFALRYPELEIIYKEQCARNEIKVGSINYYVIDGKKIINFPTKYHFKNPSRYDWIERGLQDFVSKYKKLGITSIAFPLLGCSNGDLNPNIVIDIMIKYLSSEQIDIYICSSKKLGGKEKEMLDNFKRCDVEKLFLIGKLNKVQKECILEYKDKIERFFQILEIPKIGLNTYKKFFNYFYNMGYTKNNECKTIFDFINNDC